MRKFYFISYDITDDKRRNRVARILLDYGERVQYSVFCCQVNKRELLKLQKSLKIEINNNEDQILFLQAGMVQGQSPAPTLLSLGKSWKPEPRVQII